LYAQRAPLDDVTTLSRSLRSRVGDALRLAFEPVYEATAADGLTTKWLWQAARDGVQVETVLMRTTQRATVCVSSPARSWSRSYARSTARRSACRTSCSWAWASRSPTTTRPGRRSNGCTTTS